MPTAGATRTRSRTYPAERTAKIEALQAEITDAVGALVEDSAWRAMLDTVARFYRYSRANQLAIGRQAAERGFVATRVAGFQPWKGLGRSVRKGEKGLAVLAPCSYKTGSTDQDESEDETAPEDTTARVLRGFRVVHVFDVSQTEGDELPDVLPELLTDDAPANLWDRLTDQLEAAGYTVLRGECPSIWGGYTDAAARTVTVRAGVDDAQAVTTLAHELAHILCGHTADDYDYGAFKHRAEVEAESVASIVTTWAGVYSAAPTVPHVAYRISRRPEAVRETVETVTAVARAVIDALDPDTTTQAQPTLAVAAN